MSFTSADASSAKTHACRVYILAYTEYIGCSIRIIADGVTKEELFKEVYTQPTKLSATKI
jgi:hypothetical protein